MPNENDRKDQLENGSQPQAGNAGGWNRDEERSSARGEDMGNTHGGPMPIRGDVASTPSYGGEARGESTMRDTQRASEMNPGHSPHNVGGEQPRKKQRRGFAAMDPSKQKEIASKGGKASHEQGTGHEWDSSAAREAGRKGGQASRGGRGKMPSGGEGGSTPAGGSL